MSDGYFHVYDSGAIRENKQGKGRPSLVSPHGFHRLSKHYESGGKLHGDYNWEKGMPQSSFLDSLIRHAFAYSGGDRNEDHLAAIAWNAFALMHQEEMVKRGKLDPDLLDLRVYTDGEGNQLIPYSVYDPDEFRVMKGGEDDDE